MERLRKAFIYPFKLLRSFGLFQSVGYVWAHARRSQLIRLRPRGFSADISFRPRTTDIRVIYEIITTREFDFVWPRATPPRTIVDAGANIGATTLAFKERWPGARIVSLEPDHGNFKLLQINCAGLDEVELLQRGLWSTECFLAIATQSESRGAWSIQFLPTNEPKADDVPSTTMPHLLKMFPNQECDLVKIDIEGAELELFRDGNADWMSRVGSILVECHGPQATTAVAAAAERYGFQQMNVGEKQLIWRT